MTRHRPTPHRQLVVLTVACAFVAAACAHRMSTDELVAANSQVVDGDATGGVAGPGRSQVTTPGGDPATDVTGTDSTGGGTTPGATTGGSAGEGGSTGRGSAPASGPSPVGESGGTVGTPGETGPIVIGSVGNYSGIAGPPQAPMAQAVQIWAESVNSRGGLFGREVQVILVDDRGDPAQHVAALRDLVENRGVVAFVSNAAALTIASGRQYLESVGVPVIGTACANTTEFESTIFFPQCEGVADFFTSYLKVGVTNGGVEPTLAIISCSEAQTCADGRRYMLSDGGGVERAGARLVYEAQASLAQPDYTSECRGAQQAGAKMIHVLLDPTGVIRFAQSCARQGYNPLYLQGSATVFFDSKDQPGLGNLIATSQVFNFVGTETPARQEFQDVMGSFYGGTPGPAEAYGWASAKVFELAAFRAAEAAQSITPQTLVDALHTFKRETLGGLTTPLTFPAGGPAQPAPCAFSARVQNGKWVPINNGDMICL